MAAARDALHQLHAKRKPNPFAQRHMAQPFVIIPFTVAYPVPGCVKGDPRDYYQIYFFGGDFRASARERFPDPVGAGCKLLERSDACGPH